MFVSKMFIIVSTLTWCDCSQNRVKRTINGWPIERRDGPMKAIRYAVAIGDLHNRPWWVLGIYFESLATGGVYGSVSCGGVILSPYVVQTNCHCIADLMWDSNRRKQLPVVDHNWESRSVMYVGVNEQWGDDSMMDVYPLVSQQFIPHQSCAKIIPEAGLAHDDDDDDFIVNGVISTETVFAYDFGLIRVKDPDWISGWKGVPTTNVEFAPIYSREELERIKTELTRLPVCLIVGWGDTDKEGYDTNSIRGGWSVLMSREDCLEYTATDIHGFTNLTDEEIREYMTWVCTEPFPLFFQPPGAGDSGGPTTCNNVYIGLMASFWELRDAKGNKVIKINYITAISFIFHTMFENAYNYRRAFDLSVDGWFGITYNDIIRKLTANWGNDFVDHVEDAVIEEAVDLIIEEAALAILAARSGNQSLKNSRSRSRPLGKYTSITRLMNQERVAQSFSGTFYALPVLLFFFPITLQFL